MISYINPGLFTVVTSAIQFSASDSVALNSTATMDVATIQVSMTANDTMAFGSTSTLNIITGVSMTASDSMAFGSTANMGVATVVLDVTASDTMTFGSSSTMSVITGLSMTANDSMAFSSTATMNVATVELAMTASDTMAFGSTSTLSIITGVSMTASDSMAFGSTATMDVATVELAMTASDTMTFSSTSTLSIVTSIAMTANDTMAFGSTSTLTVSTPTFNSYSINMDNSNDSVELSSDVSVGNTWTYSVWLKPDTFSGSSLFGYLAAENNDGGAGGTATRHGLGLVQSGTTNGGSGMVYYYSQTGTGSDQLSSTALTANVWNHVVVTADVSNNEMKIYLNGSLDNTITKSNIQTVFDSLGRYSNLWYYAGKMDEVGFWDSILSASDILAIYNDGEPMNLAANSGNYTASSDLIAYYRFEENSGTSIADSSSNSNTATLTNGPTFSTDVPVAYPNLYAASFDGSDDLIEVDGFNAQNIIGNGEHTVSLWVKFDTVSNYDSIFYMGASTNNSDYLQLRLREVSSQLKYQVSGRKGGSGNATVEATTLPTTGEWVHLAYTRTGTGTGATIKIYVNGSYEATATNGEFDAPLGSSSAGTLTNISAFRSSAYSQYGIDGKIDEVAVWDSALSASEISKVYNAGQAFDLNNNSGNYTSSTDLQGYWRFNDNTVSGSNGTIADSSGNSRTATTKNGVTFSTDLPEFNNGYAISCDGSNDYAPIVGSLSAGTYNFLTSTLTYSASLWFKFDDHTQNSSQVLLANNYTNSNKGIQIWYDNRSGHATKALRVNSWAGSSVSTNTASAITDNNWHHVLVTSSGASGTLTVYLDGSSLTTASLGSVTSTAPNQDLAIGGRVISGSVNSPIDGKLDEVAIWDVALSSADVTAIYNDGEPTNLAGYGSLKGYWRFEENTGTSIADNSGNGNTATLTNGPTFSTDTPT